MITSSALTHLGDYLPQSRRGRLLAAVALTVVLLAALILVLRGASNRSHAPVAAAAAQAVTTKTLETLQIARRVTANGTVYAWQEIVVGPEGGGHARSRVLESSGATEVCRLSDECLQLVNPRVESRYDAKSVATPAPAKRPRKFDRKTKKGTSDHLPVTAQVTY